MKPNCNSNHPPKGACITAEPIRDRAHITAIRELLADKPRDLCLFELGIQTNLRIGDLLALTVGRVADLKPGDVIPVRQQKRGRFGLRTLNETGYEAAQKWCMCHPGVHSTEPLYACALFPGKDGRTPITVPYASRLIKSWCTAVGLTGNYSAHSLRKTFGYHAVNTFGAPVHVVSAAFGHRDVSTTLLYLGIQEQDVKDLFLNEL
jgi:integrase